MFCLPRTIRLVAWAMDGMLEMHAGRGIRSCCLRRPKNVMTEISDEATRWYSYATSIDASEVYFNIFFPFTKLSGISTCEQRMIADLFVSKVAISPKTIKNSIIKKSICSCRLTFIACRRVDENNAFGIAADACRGLWKPFTLLSHSWHLAFQYCDLGWGNRMRLMRM